MKFYTFKRESNDFKDLFNDPIIKKYISSKIIWHEHAMIGFVHSTSESVLGYIVLKYGEEITNPVNKDYTPIPGKDYLPIRR